MLKTLQKVVPLYAFLVLELLLLRGLFHFVLKIPIGWPGTTDFDLFIPCSVAFFVFFYSLNAAEPLTIQFRAKRLIAHLLLAMALVGVTFLSTQKNPLIWFSLLVGVIFSGICLWISPRYFLRNKNKWMVIPCGLIALSVTLYQQNYHLLWPVLGELTGGLVCKLLALSPIPQASCQLSLNPETLAPQLYLKAQYYRATLAPGCVGLEGQFLNLLVFLIHISFFNQGICFVRAGLALLVGALGIFLLNLLRILVLFAFGQWSVTTDYGLLGMDFVRFAFHAHLGWILYSVFLIWLYRRFNIYIRKRSAGSNRLLLPTLNPTS